MVMKALIKDIKKLKDSPLRKRIDDRLNDFSSFKDKKGEEWFSELCFCLLTANSKAKTAICIQNELKADGFCRFSEKKIRDCIIRNKHRFHNNKSRFIVNAREHLNIKEKIQSMIKTKGEIGAREWLVKNIKGLGYKEASHFLRNVGYFNSSILDRHILKLMKESNMIKSIPKPISKKHYLDIEGRFLKLAEKMNMSAAELDLYMWYIRTGKILK
jgi:N-glycosylase/DNA lyase